MRVYVCGNPLVAEDSLPLKLLPKLKKRCPDIEFMEFDPTEDLPEEKDPIIIDTVINAKEVALFEDIDKFVSTKALSLHDFDLGLTLKLAKKAGRINSVRIIGVPKNIKEDVAVERISSLLQGLASRSARRSSCKDHTRG